MSLGSEVSILERPPSVERSGIARELPSAAALHQEGAKIASAGDSRSFDAIAAQLQLLPAARGGIDTVRLIDPEADTRSNLAKVRLARAGALHQLLRNGGSEEFPIAQRAVGLIMTDYSLREEVSAHVRIARLDNNNERAAQTDYSYLRNHGGAALERRVRDGQLTREQAIAIASSLESMDGPDFRLTTIQRAQLVNYFVKNQNAPSIQINMDGITQEKLQQVVSEIRLRRWAFGNILNTSFARGENRDGVAFSQFTGILDTVMGEYHEVQDYAGLQSRVESIIEKDQVPSQFSRLPEIVDILKDHPEIKAVSFDLYDTLVQWTSNQTERRERMNQLSAIFLKKKFGLTVTQDQVRSVANPAWDRRWNDYQAKGDEVDIRETIGWMVDGLLQDRTVSGGRQTDPQTREAMITELEKTWYRVELETAVEMPGARQTLEQLKARGIKIGLTSNASWSEAHIRRVLNRFGLRDHFDAISYSAEMGKMKKPNVVDFFHHSWAKLGVRPDQVFHVGDNPWDDYEGGKNAGAKAARYVLPEGYNDIDHNAGYYASHPEEYQQRALAYHVEAQNQAALARVEGFMDRYRVPLAERERLRTMALEVYQKTRDVIGPAYVTLASDLLGKLASGEADMSLALARDGLPLAIAQKLLRAREPERYEGVSKDQIRYTYISRRFLERMETDDAFRQKYQEYLRGLGITDDVRNVVISDILCGSGKTHEGIKKLLAGKEVEGWYIDSHQTQAIPDAHSYLKESLRDESAFLRNQDMLLLFETLFSGPYESATDIEGVFPEMKRKELPADVLVRGLSEQSIHLLNFIAIKGLMDTVETFHRRRLLNIGDRPPYEVMDNFYTFIASPPSGVWVDIWRSVPWQDYGQWFLPSNNPLESEARDGGKIH